MQADLDTAEAFSDVNWAGCRQSRKSTSGGVVMIGGHLIKAYSKTQALIAKSSAESELFGIVRATCEALGFITLVQDMGKEVKSRLHMDANAAQGIIDRQGLSKVRHLDSNTLWLQEQMARDAVPLIKVPGPYNCADLMTKHVPAALIRRHSEHMSLEFREGRMERGGKLQYLAKTQRQAQAQDHMISVCEKYDRSHRQDKWISRGADGEWTRLHDTPRRSLFTPCRVARGPAHPDKLEGKRVRVGVFADGEQFKLEDGWRERGLAHRVLNKPWTGVTRFKVRRICWADE